MRKILAMLLTMIFISSIVPPFISGVAGTDSLFSESMGELQYPIEDYVVNGYYFGEYLPTSEYPNRYHLGEDICKPAETKVVAMADGTVKVANGDHTSYGGLVIIEHQLGDGNEYCSLYGHLKHSETLVEPGDAVSKGQPIGELSGDPADYGGTVPHLHFGIRYGAFPGESALDPDTTSGWYWGGYGTKDPRDVNNWWLKPSDFIAGWSTIDLSLVSLYTQSFPFIYLTVRASRDGQPVGNLTRDNFSVTEDDRIQTDMFDVVPPEEGGGVRMADIVFLIDTSGSMSTEIAAVRNNCESFADALVASDIDYRLGLVQFGQSANGGQPRLIGSGLTGNVNEFRSWVTTLAASGGTEPGFAAIRLAIQSYSFRPGSQKVFILITDEDSDDRDKQTTIDMILANEVAVHVAVDCAFGTSSADYCGAGSIRDVSGGLQFSVTGDYRDILDTIGEVVANAYIVRYRTDNPVLDGLERTVVCTVQDGTATDFVQCTYIPGGTPHIQRTEETMALHEQSLVALSSPTISVEVTDAAAPFVEGVFLYVRTSGSGTGYVQISMSSQGNDIYSAVVPAEYVCSPGLDYYIRATDGEVTSSDPTTDPDMYPYQIAVLPNEAPVITHTPPTSWASGDDVSLEISASDGTYGVTGLIVYYRQQGDLLWQSVSRSYSPPETAITENVILPVAAWNTEVIEYYVKVTDDFGVYKVCPDGGADDPYLLVADMPTLLQVPYYSQDSTDWCMPVSMSMIFKYYGLNIHPWDIAEDWHLDIGQALGGWTMHSNARKYFNNHGLHADDIDIDFDVFRDSIDNGNPVFLAMVSLNPIGGLGHAVVIIGYKEEEGGNKVYLHDPSGALAERDIGRGRTYMAREVDWSQLVQNCGMRSFAVSVSGSLHSRPKGTIDFFSMQSMQLTFQRIGVSGYHCSSSYSRNAGLIWDYSTGSPFAFGPDDVLLLNLYVANQCANTQAYTFWVEFMKEVGEGQLQSFIRLFDVEVDTRDTSLVFDRITLGDVIGDYGEYAVILKLLDGKDMSVRYDEITLPNITYSPIVPPTAKFTASRTSGHWPLWVSFSDDSEGEIDSWLWDFGDGKKSTQQDPSHMYTKSGVYTVKLTVSGAMGAHTEVKENYIEVNPWL